MVYKTQSELLTIILRKALILLCGVPYNDHDAPKQPSTEAKTQSLCTDKEVSHLTSPTDFIVLLIQLHRIEVDNEKGNFPHYQCVVILEKHIYKAISQRNKL